MPLVIILYYIKKADFARGITWIISAKTLDPVVNVGMAFTRPSAGGRVPTSTTGLIFKYFFRMMVVYGH